MVKSRLTKPQGAELTSSNEWVRMVRKALDCSKQKKALQEILAQLVEDDCDEEALSGLLMQVVFHKQLALGSQIGPRSILDSTLSRQSQKDTRALPRDLREMAERLAKLKTEPLMMRDKLVLATIARSKDDLLAIADFLDELPERLRPYAGKAASQAPCVLVDYVRRKTGAPHYRELVMLIECCIAQGNRTENFNEASIKSEADALRKSCSPSRSTLTPASKKVLERVKSYRT